MSILIKGPAGTILVEEKDVERYLKKGYTLVDAPKDEVEVKIEPEPAEAKADVTEPTIEE